MDDILNLPLDERLVEVQKLLDKHPDRVPVVFRCSKECSFAKKIKNPRMVLPRTQRIVDVAKGMRKQFNLTAEVSMCFSNNDAILASSMTMAEAYEKYKSEDLVLYLKIHELSPFG